MNKIEKNSFSIELLTINNEANISESINKLIYDYKQENSKINEFINDKHQAIDDAYQINKDENKLEKLKEINEIER